jgi:hypothetical protein
MGHPNRFSISLFPKQVRLLKILPDFPVILTDFARILPATLSMRGVRLMVLKVKVAPDFAAIFTYFAHIFGEFRKCDFKTFPKA